MLPIHASIEDGHSHKMCSTVSFSVAQKNTEVLLDYFRFNKLSFVVRILVQALHIKTLAELRTFKFHTTFHIDVYPTGGILPRYA